MRSRSLAFVFVCAALFPQQPLSVAVIGFVEDHQGSDDGIDGPALRVAFIRKGDDWVPAVNDPQESTASLNHCTLPGIAAPQVWQVLDQGKPIGSAKTEGWSGSRFYSSNGLLRVKETIPFRGKASALFGGWGGGDRHRPMLAILAISSFKATTWREATVNRRDFSLAWPAFKKEVPTIPRCDASGDPIRPEPHTSKEDMEVTKAYTDRAGQRLLCASLKHNRLGPCDGLQDRPISDYWFFVDREGTTQPLGMPEGDDALALTPLDFAQLDGRSAMLFYCSGYDRDGYIIYYDRFRKSARFFWNYH